jgi:hypothetical protein
MSAGRQSPTASLLSDGRVLIAGGTSGSATLASAELYDPATGKFSPVSSKAPSGLAAATLSDGRVLVVGLGTAGLYNPTTGSFTTTGRYTRALGSTQAVALPDGDAVVVAGTSAQLYDPKTGTFSSVGEAPSAGPFEFTTTLLHDGRILVAGGETGSMVGTTLKLVYTNSAELLQP